MSYIGVKEMTNINFVYKSNARKTYSIFTQIYTK